MLPFGASLHQRTLYPGVTEAKSGSGSPGQVAAHDSEPLLPQKDEEMMKER